MYKMWSKAEVDLLKQLYNTEKVYKIAEVMNRNPMSVSEKIIQLGLKNKKCIKCGADLVGKTIKRCNPCKEKYRVEYLNKWRDKQKEKAGNGPRRKKVLVDPNLSIEEKRNIRKQRRNNYLKEWARLKTGYYNRQHFPESTSKEERSKTKQRRYYLKRRNNGKCREARRIYLKNIQVKISCNFRTRIWCSIKRTNPLGKKYFKFNFIIGCNTDQLIKHLESQFQQNMSWENYGLHGWHIDHKLPCASFDLTKSEEQMRCFHYSNLQPLWAKDNLSKGSKIISQIKVAS